MKKINFNKELTNYERLIWKKLAFYVQDFDENTDALVEIIEEFNLPYPCNLNREEILTALQADKICFKDPKNEELLQIYTFSYLDEERKNFVIKQNSYKYQSLQINRWNKSLNNIYKDLYDELIKENISIEINKLSNNLFEYLMTHVNLVSQYFLRYNQACEKDMSLEQFCGRKPLKYQYDYKCFPTIINAVCFSDKIENHENYIKHYTLLYPCIILLRGYCAFSTLIALLLDSKTMEVFPIGFSKLVDFLLKNLQDSCIYKIERPTCSPLNGEKSSVRGSESYTTQLKVYLFDKDFNPILLRIDLPHKGENKLHINIDSLTSRSELDHYTLEANTANIDSFFDSLHEQMNNETPNLLAWKDSKKNDDCKILNEMNDFICYDRICLHYFDRNNKEEDVNITDETQGLINKLSFQPNTDSYADLLLDLYTNCTNNHSI